MSMRFPSLPFIVATALWLCSTPAAVEAAYTSTVVGSTATMTGDVAGDTLTITQSGGLFRHNRYTAGDAGFNSDFDFNTGVAGDQTIGSTAGIINIDAGDGNDIIALGDGINIRGTIDGGAGIDTLDYSAYTTAVGVNLGLGTTGMSATMGADQENPPTGHPATGTATVSNYNIVTHTFDINVVVTNLAPSEVTGFHIHQAVVGVNGPIIVDFIPLSGLIVPAGTGFTFTATGLTLPTVNEAGFLGGGTYVNVHTPVFPSGAIRGQLFSNGNVNLTTGAATGVASVTNVENATGGTSADSLVGSAAVNTLSGGAGADWLVGGPGNDTLIGDAGADVMVWSNGDGTDVDEGGADADTVNVNGSTAAADVFTVAANGTRIRFDRTNLGPFSLDVGTTETLLVNGVGGDDSFTVNALAGVAALSAVNLNGFDGNDLFAFIPTTAGAVSLNVHGGIGTDTLQGPNGTATWNVTAPGAGTIAGLVSSFRFVEALNGGTGNDTFNVRAFSSGTPTVIGGAGTNTLNYNAESRFVLGDRIPPDGILDSPGVQSLSFSQIATVNIINSQPPVVDLNGDGRGDAFLYNVANGAYSNQVNNGTGGFASSAAVWDAGWQVYPVNLNTDVFTDFFLYHPVRGVWVQARNNAGAGTFTYTSGNFNADWQVHPADLDGNGVTDLFVYNVTTGVWVKCFVNGSGDFANFTPGQWDPGWTLTTADLNGDGRDDFHLYNRTSGVWVQAASQAGVGSFDYPAVGQWDTGWQITAADLNGDRRTDLFLLNAAGTHFSALSRAGGDYDYVGGRQWSPGWSVNPGDLNNDGRLDLFLYNPVNGTWVEAFSDGFGDFTFPGSGQFDPGWTVGVTDLNADGRADLLVSNVNGVFVQLTNTGNGVFTSSAGTFGTGWQVFTRRSTDR